jgi:hypothetical protein
MRTATAAVKRAAGGRISFRKGMARMAMKRNAPASKPKSERIKVFYSVIVRNVAIWFPPAYFLSAALFNTTAIAAIDEEDECLI